MGAGKSTVARALSKRLGWRVEDVDERIEVRERRSISSIFSQSGEPYFRSVERAVLTELLPEREVIVATGGGTFADPENRAAMLATGAVAWLDVPFEQILRRVPADGRRPLAGDRVQLQQLFSHRLTSYQFAHVRVDGARPIDEVVERLLEWIGY
jgi:shikimate kinase